MQRLLVGSAASNLRRCPRQQLLLATRSHVSTRRLVPPPITATAPYPTSAKLPSTLHIQSTAFSTNNDGGSSTTESPQKKLGVIAKIRHVLRTVFGTNDHTPRGIQERKDMYWVVLSVSHRLLRMENQRKLLLNSNNEQETAQPSSLVWQGESNEQLKDLMDVAVSHLDEKTDINELSLIRLRKEIQTFLEPQIVQMLTVAHDVEDAMDSFHGVEEDEEEDYAFSEQEEQEYKEILLQEYESVCHLLQDGEGTTEGVDKEQKRKSDPVPYYEIKKGAIETVLTYFDWWPEDANAPLKSTDADEKDYLDEFGFSPNMSDSEILPAMRYYHVRNLVRSSLVRRAPDNTDSSIDNDNNNSDDTQQPHCYHSLLPFKSTIPSAGRGVFVDGFAPAGTLLSFLPGKVWPKEHLQSASLQTQMQFSENDPRDQLSMRYDDVLIDSRQSPYTVVKNLWALGHIVNHPPAPTAMATPFQQATSKKENGESDNNDTNHHPHQGPNCVIVPINFTDRMERNLDKIHDYIPNEYELAPKHWAKNAFDKDEIIMHGMGLVSLRDVKDEELFYDYRLSPDKDVKGGGHLYPSWYYVWDQEAVNNRWNMDD